MDQWSDMTAMERPFPHIPLLVSSSFLKEKRQNQLFVDTSIVTTADIGNGHSMAIMSDHRSTDVTVKRS